jgi:hypothetical protein
MTEIYLCHGNLVEGVHRPVLSIGSYSPYDALITRNESLSFDAPVTLALRLKDNSEVTEGFFRHIANTLKMYYFDGIQKTKVPLQDLPLYIGWAWKTPEFLDLLKRDCDA